MAADGAALFAQLQSVAGEDADADLYYDPDSGWDIDALLSDMSVYGLDLQATPPQQHAQGTPPPVTPPPASSTAAGGGGVEPLSPQLGFEEMLASAARSPKI